MMARPGAVLFDLDGTLLDTAPDMVASLNSLRAEEGLAPLPYALARDHVSNGALGLLRVAFGELDDVRRPRLHRRYLELYRERLCLETRLFPGMETILDELERNAIAWGVVTNKPQHLTEPLMEGLDLLTRAACVVSGDTLPERKPHPRPVLHALERIAVAPERAVYVGDAARDIEAGRAAGVATIAVRFGYIEPDADIGTWNADHVVATTAELASLLLPEIAEYVKARR